VNVKVFLKSILELFSLKFNLLASSKTFSGKPNLNQASIISDSILIQGLSLFHKISIILHSGLFQSHLVIFIATLSQFLISL
jgi:hypothetical protein